MIIPIYDRGGAVVGRLEIDDDLTHVNGRVWRGRRHYYKGVGVHYSWHYAESVDASHVVLAQSDVFYMGHRVCAVPFVGKTGIFQDRFQPQFTDFIGACGVKELSIIEHSELFPRSSVRVVDAVNFDRDNGQYYFVLDYVCGRRKYLPHGDPMQLRALIETMLAEHWNFIWDKNVISDITERGEVSDVADIFYSRDIGHKLGTVYAVLYSLGRNDPAKYMEFLGVNGLSHADLTSYALNSVAILRACGVDTSRLTPYGDSYRNFEHVVLDYLVVGRNCGHCCYVGLGEKIKARYLRQARKHLARNRKIMRRAKRADCGLGPFTEVIAS